MHRRWKKNPRVLPITSNLYKYWLSLYAIFLQSAIAYTFSFQELIVYVGKKKKILSDGVFKMFSSSYFFILDDRWVFLIRTFSLKSIQNLLCTERKVFDVILRKFVEGYKEEIFRDFPSIKFEGVRKDQLMKSSYLG